MGRPTAPAVTTRNLRDAKCRLPDGTTLHFDIECQTDNTVAESVATELGVGGEAGRPVEGGDEGEAEECREGLDAEERRGGESVSEVGQDGQQVGQYNRVGSSRDRG